jgi:acyl carrier protein
MNSEQIFEKVNQVFRRVFSNDLIQVNRETTAKDIAGWDSITHLDIITGMEEEFKVEITGFEVMNLNNVGDLLDLLAQKLAE